MQAMGRQSFDSREYFKVRGLQEEASNENECLDVHTQAHLATQ